MIGVFPKGTRMSDVPADFRGIGFRQWRAQDIAEQCSEYLSKLNPEDAPLSKQRLWNPRDGYGMKGY